MSDRICYHREAHTSLKGVLHSHHIRNSPRGRPTAAQARGLFSSKANLARPKSGIFGNLEGDGIRKRIEFPGKG